MWGCYLGGVIVRGGLSVYKLNTYGNGVCYKITTTINVRLVVVVIFTNL